MRLFLASIGSAMALAGCTTTSFAPPPVAVTYSGANTGIGSTCPASGQGRFAIEVNRDVDGAYRLLDTFIETYRCAAHAAANGRQAFEIPVFLSTAGAAAAGALGGGPIYGIVGTTASSAFASGNSYWDPKLKASIYDHALDALICVKTEAVGIAAFKTEDEPAEAIQKYSNAVGGGTVKVPVTRQYFEMVSSAAFSIERILAQRLSNMAPVDAGAVAAQLAEALKQIRAKEAERKAALAASGGQDPDPAPSADADGDGEIDEAEAADALEKAAEATDEPQTFKAAFWARRLMDEPDEAMAELDLGVLKPKLDECVIRAKL